MKVEFDAKDVSVQTSVENPRKKFRDAAFSCERRRKSPSNRLDHFPLDVSEWTGSMNHHYWRFFVIDAEVNVLPSLNIELVLIKILKKRHPSSSCRTNPNRVSDQIRGFSKENVKMGEEKKSYEAAENRTNERTNEEKSIKSIRSFLRLVIERRSEINHHHFHLCRCDERMKVLLRQLVMFFFSTCINEECRAI